MQTNFKAAVVWSGTNCPWCERAKALLDTHNIPYTTKHIGVHVTKEEFFEANRGARTVPQVWLDDVLVGGFEDLKKVLAGDPTQAA